MVHGETIERSSRGDADVHDITDDVRAAVARSGLRPDLAVPVVDGALTLGTWQQVILVDFDDRPRNRTVVVQIMGDR